MTEFPDIIRVKVTDSMVGDPVCNVILNIMLFANHKNNYGFPLPLTNIKGIVEITKEWLSENVEQTRSIFIMDFSSTLEDCQPRFEIKIYDKDKTIGLIQAQKQYQKTLGISQKQINGYEHADNYKYCYAAKQFELTGERIMEVEFKVQKAGSCLDDSS